MASQFGIQSFSNASELFESLQKSKQKLDGEVHDWQCRLKAGDHAAMLFSAYGDRFWIFYEILELDPRDPPLAEHARLVRGYSIAEPEGEMGLVHVANLDTTLTPEQFEEWRRRGWAAPV